MKDAILVDFPRAVKGFLKTIKYNFPWYQKRHWKKELQKYDWNQKKLFGYEWGDPENSNDRWGNYLEIKKRLLFHISPTSTVLEIGSLGGKWTQYMVHARKVICVDVNALGFAYIKKKLPYGNISFYLTRGDELEGIANNTVDVLFSVDTLVRVPKKFIKRYFMEANRVLKPGGRVLLHLPCTQKPVSRAKGFTRLSLKEIEQYCAESLFEDMNIDENIIIHGIILEARKSANSHYA